MGFKRKNRRPDRIATSHGSGFAHYFGCYRDVNLYVCDDCGGITLDHADFEHVWSASDVTSALRLVDFVLLQGEAAAVRDFEQRSPRYLALASHGRVH